MKILFLARDYRTQSSNKEEPEIAAYGQVDALMYTAMKSKEVTQLESIPFHGFVVIDRETAICVEKSRSIFMMVKDIVRVDPECQHSPIIKISVSVFLEDNEEDEEKSMGTLVQFLEDLHQQHLVRIQNELLGRQFYFDQKYRPSDRVDLRGNPHDEDATKARAYELARAPKHLSFCRVPFSSNKAFGNLFGPGIRQIENRVRRFVDNKDWYRKKGVPYQLGILLRGVPGTGKTSCVGAIANMTGRHIVAVHCGEIMTHTQLRRLFYEPVLHVYADDDMNQTIAVRIPIDQRIYLLEELDAIPSTLSEKALAHMKQSMPAAEQKSMGMNTGLFNEIQTGHWLQILDDVNQVDGRILLITSNHPEKLDQRLLRPGRIDLNIDLGKASRSTIVSMIEHFTDQVVPSGIIDHIPDGVLSPASVSCIIQKNLDDLVSIVRELDMASQNPDQQGNECDGSQMTGDPIGINEEGPNAIVDRTLKRVPITSYQTQRLFG